MKNVMTDMVVMRISEMMIGVARISIEIHNQMIVIAHSDGIMKRVMVIVCNQMNVTGVQAHSKEILFDRRQLVKDHQFMIDHRFEKIHLDGITI